MKNFIYPVLIVIIAVICVIVSDLVTAYGLLQLPMDITGNIYWLGLLPTHMIVIGIVVFVFRGLFAWNRIWYVPLFILVLSGFNVFYLRVFFNPLDTIVLYLASAIPVCLFWFALRWTKLAR